MVNNRISIPLGIIIGLLASFVQSLGLTIQRKSHVQNQSLPDHRRRVEHRRPLWLLGFIIFISSNILGSFVQIASLPVVILAPLGAVSLLWNAFFARFLLGDKFSPWMILGTILIAGGAILIAFFGIVPEQTRSLEDLLWLFRRPTFIVYFSILGFIVFISLAITHITEYSLSRRLANEFPTAEDSSDFSASSLTITLPTHAANLTNSISENVNDATIITTEQTPLLYSKSNHTSTPSSSSSDESQTGNPAVPAVNRIRLFLAISYASFSGIISGMCLLFAKSGVELLVLTLGGDNQFRRWETWMLVLGLIVFALLQLWYLHKALILADPTLVCPSAFCFYNLSSIVNGLVYFNQFSLIPPLHLGLVSLGIFVLLCGVWIVSIQPGSGGGVDVGPWTEEGVNLPGEDLALYAGHDEEDIERPPSQYLYLQDQDSASAPHSSQHVGPVPIQRSTVSEPNVSAPIGLGIDLGPGHGEERLTQSSILPSGKRKRAETSLYTSPRAPSQRRLSGDSPAHIGHSRTMSYPYPTQMPMSPSSGTASGMSTGFQIGLSPLSPGFTILPLERRRRPSGLQNGASVADAVDEGAGDTREQRRAVSEGEASNAARGESGERGTRNASDSHVEAEDANLFRTHTRSRENGLIENSQRRWEWLRGLFRRKE